MTFGADRLVAGVRALGALGPLALFVVVAPALGAMLLVVTEQHWFGPLEGMGFGAVPLFLAASIILAGLSFVPTHAVSLVGGMLFGATAGSLLAMAGVTGAALLGYLALRRVVGDRALAGLECRPGAAAVHRALVHGGARRTFALVALVRLSPVMPFAGTNLLLAAAGMGLRDFLLGSIVGLAPRVVAVAVAGAGLASLDLDRAADARVALLGAVATVAALWVIGRVARSALRQAAVLTP